MIFKTALFFIGFMVLGILGVLFPQYFQVTFGLSMSLMLVPYYVWGYQCAATQKTFGNNKPAKIIIVIACLQALTLPALLWLFLFMNMQDENPIVMTLAFGFFACFIAMFVVASLSICKSEATAFPERKSTHVIITFFALYYLPIGMFFLGPRLKRLEAQ